MKTLKVLFILLLSAAIVPFNVSGAIVEAAEGVFVDGTKLYISSSVESLPDLQLNPTDIYCYAVTPPTCTENTFTGYDGTLHIPRSSMDAYISALYWNYFIHYSIDAIEPQTVSISQESLTMEIMDNIVLTASVYPANATPNDVTWSSSNTQVATVINGKVTAVGNGECDIIASCFDKIAACHVKVTAQATIEVLTDAINIITNQSTTLAVYCYPYWTDLVVTSSDPSVARATTTSDPSRILVEGISEGKATITVSSADGNATPDSCIVWVHAPQGDVNIDGNVTIDDVTSLIDYLLTDDSSSISLNNADTNYDGHINIDDLTCLIDYLLSGNWPASKDAKLTFVFNDISFTMILVKAGTFTMGATEEQLDDAYDSEKPAHEVTISHDFYICETEVTKQLWRSIMGSDPSYIGSSNLCPVTNVNWNMCQEFITKLNEFTGQNFRLPTEAEWEFAARGGNLSQGYKYSGSDDINEVAWYNNNSTLGNIAYTHPVGQKKANELGLYDMSGNAKEWCQDYYGLFSNDSQIDPTGPTSGNYRVTRGGYAGTISKNCRTSARFSTDPSFGSVYNGLRLAL
ncbi:MAG: SUMF1/EgtB/PvdO family nonheme iron enzyme [Muribaculaceae bacterium]|nr:SUMF1/EgtB/PvdO family nonheme iron enzyme [Muribaculaceae bacterium]